jgi:hypothetical protein
MSVVALLARFEIMRPFFEDGVPLTQLAREQQIDGMPHWSIRAVFTPIEWLVLKPLISTISGWF